MSDFEWDKRKSDATFRARGFDFEFVKRIFEGRTFERDDDRLDYGERRLCATGVVEGMVFTVVYTWRSGKRRIISARAATRKERNAYRAIYR